MLGRWMPLFALVALLWPVESQAQTFEITRELAAPQHVYSNFPPFFTSTLDYMAFPAAPNPQFAISSYSTIRLRLVAPFGKKFVCTQPRQFSWPADIKLVPVGSTSSATLYVCPSAWSFTTLAGTAPSATVEALRSDADWLMIRSTGTGESSANFEFTELVLEWDVSGLGGSLHEYAISDGGGSSSGPEIHFYKSLASGAPDPGQAVFLEDLEVVGPVCEPNSTTWPVCGAPVAVKPGPQLRTFITADGAGGAFVSYQHEDSLAATNSDIWLNRLDASGNAVLGWPEDGFPVCELASAQFLSGTVADGSGGAFVAWRDSRNDPVDGFLDIYVQRITASGAPAPGWPVDGVACHPTTPFVDEVFSGLVADGTGGAFVSWSGLLIRLTATGTVAPGWPAGGMAIGTSDAKLLADGVGGVYLGWDSGSALRLVRISSSGTIAPGWPPSGQIVSATSPIEFAIDLGQAGDHVNVSWVEPSLQYVYVSRLLANGSFDPAWQVPVLVSGPYYPKSNLTVANGGTTGDVVVLWREDLPAPAGFQVVAQRLTPAAQVAPGWPASVIADGRYLRAFPDCEGGTTLAYFSDGIRAIRFTETATTAPGWPSDGVLLCDGDFLTVVPSGNWACPDGTGGVMTTISRLEAGTPNPFETGDVHAQCVRGDGSAAVGYVDLTPVGSNVTAQLGPASVSFATVTTAGDSWLEVAESGPSLPAGVQIVPSDPAVYYDVTTAAEYQGPVQICISYDPATVQGPESALRLWHYDTTAMPEAWVDITTSVDELNNVICGSTLSLSPFVVVEGSVTDAGEAPRTPHRLFANVPNPFNPSTTIRYELGASGPVRLDVLDVSGRLVCTLVNQRVEAGQHEIQWNGQDAKGQRVASGVYVYRLEAGSLVSTRRMVLLK